MKEGPPDQDLDAAEMARRVRELTLFLELLQNRRPRGVWKTDIGRYNDKAGESLPIDEKDPERRCQILATRRQELEASTEYPGIKELKLAILRKLLIEYTSHLEHL